LATRASDLLVLLLGEALGLDGIDADGHTHALGDAEAVAGEDGDAAYAQVAQPLDHAAGVAADLVLKAHQRRGTARRDHHVHAGHALDVLLSTASMTFGRPGLSFLSQLARPTSSSPLPLLGAHALAVDLLGCPARRG
jgi:hypothetical protein